MRINPRMRLFALVLVLVVLVGAAGYIGYQIYNTSQAPEDSSAAGGQWYVGGWPQDQDLAKWDECKRIANPCEANTGYDSYCICAGSSYPGSIACNGDAGSAPTDFSNAETITGGGSECGGGGGGGGSSCGDGICQSGELCEDLKVGGVSAGSRLCQTGDTGGAPSGGRVPSCTFSGTNACQQNTVVTSECGGTCIRNSDCATGHVCGDDNLCIATECSTPGACVDECTPPTTSECGETCTTDGQCGTGHSCSEGVCTLDECLVDGACSDECTPIEDEALCGDSFCDAGEECELVSGDTYRLCTATGAAPTGDIVTCNTTTGTNACTVESVTTDEQTLTVIQVGDPVCAVDGSIAVDYVVTVSNIGNADAEYDSVVVTLDSNVTTLDVSDISGAGQLVSNQITWPGATITAGGEDTFTYTMNVTTQDASALDNVSNTVNVTYDPADPKEVSYSLDTDLVCDPPGLPSTGIEDYRMYILAISLMALGAVVYELKFGSAGIERLLLFGRASADKLVNRSEYKKESYEQNVVEDSLED